MSFMSKDMSTETQLRIHYLNVRERTAALCDPLEKEDYVVQPIPEVSPPKWHLGHTTWFFETFVLKVFLKDYQEYNGHFDYVFNSYYESVGERVIRTDRGNLSRPSVDEVYAYRNYVDACMLELLSVSPLGQQIQTLINLGLQHEQQHQELLVTDIKYILGHNPLFPAYLSAISRKQEEIFKKNTWLSISAGLYAIGFEGPGFAFDNESGRHQIWLGDYQISANLVTNSEYLDFINAGGYRKFSYWHAEGWEWVKQQQIESPLYWHYIDGSWMHYTLYGLKPVLGEDNLCHINFYEASAFAAWKGMRLPTEAEWEVASSQFDWGKRWEWTNSAYLPYPAFKKAAGAIGEYNGKFMVNQMVLRGASEATAEGHSRATYRNFFHSHLRWQMTGLRLVK